MHPIYLDSSATTPVLPAVLAAMAPYWTDTFGNPASAHRVGQRARQALENAREQVAGFLNAAPEEVIFTSGATEANNLALHGLAGSPPGQLLISSVEHPSVMEPVRRLAELGFTLTHLPVDEQGVVKGDALTLGPEARLVAIQMVNHETGVIQPISDLVRTVGGRCYVHCDAAQAAGKLPVRFRELGVDSLTISGHKFHGPKGIGVLIVKSGSRLRPQQHGGHQQQGRRPGTEPVALAVGLATALQLAHDEREVRERKVRQLRQLFLDCLHAGAVLVNPGAGNVSPYTLNVSFPGCQADLLLMNLDLAGVACSTGSACSSGSLLPSPVLQAMGIAGDRLRSAMRFSFSSLLTDEEVVEAGKRVAAVVNRLRSCS